MPLVKLFAALFEAYAVLGLLFACAFLTKGICRVDPASNGSNIGFRLIIFPGVAALWPMMLKRWIQGKGQTT